MSRVMCGPLAVKVVMPREVMPLQNCSNVGGGTKWPGSVSG